MRVDLPSGGWVEIRGIDDLRSKDMRAMQKQFVLLAGDGEGAEARANYVYATDRILSVCITDWNIPYLPDARVPRAQNPGEDSNLDELTIADMRKLEAAAEQIREAVFPTERIAVDPVSGAPDPSTPTEAVSAPPSV